MLHISTGLGKAERNDRSVLGTSPIETNGWDIRNCIDYTRLMLHEYSQTVHSQSDPHELGLAINTTRRAFHIPRGVESGGRTSFSKRDGEVGPWSEARRALVNGFSAVLVDCTGRLK